MQNENINKRKMLLELGDIIQIIAPNNSEIHNHNFLEPKIKFDSKQSWYYIFSLI